MMDYLLMYLHIQCKMFHLCKFVTFGLESINIFTQAIWVLEMSCVFDNYMWKLILIFKNYFRNVIC